jgi:hypothetical protein
MNEIKAHYRDKKLHIYLLRLAATMTQNSKVLANVSYALSSLAYMQADVCIEVAAMTQ